MSYMLLKYLNFGTDKIMSAEIHFCAKCEHTIASHVCLITAASGKEYMAVCRCVGMLWHHTK